MAFSLCFLKLARDMGDGSCHNLSLVRMVVLSEAFKWMVGFEDCGVTGSGWMDIRTNAYSESLNTVLPCCCLVVAIHDAVLIAIGFHALTAIFFLEALVPNFQLVLGRFFHTFEQYTPNKDVFSPLFGENSHFD